MAIKEIKREWCPSQLAYVKEFLLHCEEELQHMPRCSVGSKATVSETDNEYVKTTDGWKLLCDCDEDGGQGAGGSGGVKTVNGVEPDENGNIQIDVGGGGSSEQPVVILPETSLTFDENNWDFYLGTALNATPEVGKTYIVNYNGDDYECKAVEWHDGRAVRTMLGNVGLAGSPNWDDNIPFCLTVYSTKYNGRYLTCMVNGSNDPVTLSIVSKVGEEDGGITGFIYDDTHYKIADNAYAGNNGIFAVSVQAKEIGNSAFQNCNSLYHVNALQCGDVKEGAFDGCAMLEKAYFSDSCTIGKNAFQGCTRLKSFDSTIYEIPYGAFSGCESLEHVSCTSADIVDTFAFSGCKALKKLDFEYVGSIGSSAFYNCGIETLILRMYEVCENKLANGFYNTPINRGTGYIYVRKDLVDAYKSHSQWSQHAAQIRAIEDHPDICGEL